MRIATLALAVAALLAVGGCNRSGAPIDAGKAPSLQFDTPVSGEITTRSGLNFNDGSHHQLYQLELQDKQLVGLTLTGSLNGSLAVFNNGVQVVRSNSGFERGQAGSLAFRANGAGTYVVAVNADGPSTFGPYRLRAEKLVPYSGKPLRDGGEIADVLVSGSQDYTLQVDKAGMYDIVLQSHAFDTVLKLDGNGTQAENDDGGDDTNSRISLPLEPGRYTLQVRGLGDEDVGAFTLTAKRTALPANIIERDGTALPATGSVFTQLDPQGRRRFLLTLQRPAVVRLDAISSQVDTLLRVVGADVEREDDDGGNGTNARLHESLEAGHYTVDVSSINDAPGLVEVRVQIDGTDAMDADEDAIAR